MRLYHYTNIETLALILKNKTIRFSRLDQVDDLEEGSTQSSGIKPGLYTFVSCWTDDPEESIPLWKMYTDNGIGVRIGVEKDMFKRFIYKDGDIIDGGRLTVDKPHQKPISQDKVIKDDYWVLPNFNDGVFFKRVEYVHDVNLAMQGAVERNMFGIHQLNTSKWGIYKNIRWSFQRESRFTLIIFPKSKTISVGDARYNSWLQRALKDGVCPQISFFDLDLDESVLKTIDITMCPNMGEGHKILVESLCKTFLPNITPRESSLSKCVKIK